ncbi:MAG: T9SS type A sorting domain-containing protein, partial [Planctomycetes bacterium]|nr:T9SS type A sorting domain-containing protein [Planctomycetota bacterium]
TWTDISADLPYRWVTRINVDPYDPATAYVAFSGLKWSDLEPHLFRTTDMGATWTDISANLPNGPINVVRVDPFYPNYLYVGSDVGCFYSINYGQSWLPLGEGMPIVSVYDIKIHRILHFLVAGTHGRSMYKIDLNEIESIEEDEKEAITAAKLPSLAQNYPNPFNPSTTIAYKLPQSSRVSLKVYNISGQLVRSLVDEHKPAGNYEVVWGGNDNQGQAVSSGKYLYTLKAGDHIETRFCTFLK